jgi:lipopolysaccharide export system protein LptA
MTIGSNGSVWTALLTGMLIFVSHDAGAASKAAARPTPADSSSPIQILPGTSSKEPVSIDADKLVYYDKEKKAIYSGNVVVVQGDTKMTCSVMTVFLDRSPTPGVGAPDRPKHGFKPDADSPRGSPSATGSGVTRLEATGPVTVISKSQVATGDNAIYDKRENKVRLIGHVTLSDGQNVTTGDKLTYDLKTSQATIDTAGSKSGRVHGQFLPNAGADATKPK